MEAYLRSLKQLLLGVSRASLLAEVRAVYSRVPTEHDIVESLAAAICRTVFIYKLGAASSSSQALWV